jgi:hypothetical protein
MNDKMWRGKFLEFVQLNWLAQRIPACKYGLNSTIVACENRQVDHGTCLTPFVLLCLRYLEVVVESDHVFKGLRRIDVIQTSPLSMENGLWSQKCFSVIISSKGRISFRPRTQRDKSTKIGTLFQNSLSFLHYLETLDQHPTSPSKLAIHLLFSRWDLLRLLSTLMSFETLNQMTRLSPPSWCQPLEASFHARSLSSDSQRSSTFLSLSSRACLSRQ